MGLVSAENEHNRRGDEALLGIDNIAKIVEDVLIYDVDLDQHVQRVRDVVCHCAEHGITLNKRKFVLAANEVSYRGFRVSYNGYSVDDHLVQALRNFRPPTSKTEVRSFSGLAQQFESFCPQLAEWLSPLRSLLS